MRAFIGMLQATHMRSLFVTLSVAGVVVSSGALNASPAPAVSSVLPNGITLVTRADRTAPRIAISLVVRAGVGDETAETAGWRRLLTEAMLRASLRGSASQTARTMSQLQREAEAAGGRSGAGVTDDVIEFWATGASGNASQLLDLLLSVVQSPRLGDQDIKAARDRLLSRLDTENDDVARRAIAALRSQLYRDARGELTAYGLPENGTEASLNALTADRVRDYYKSYFQPARFVIAVTGDFDEARLKARLANAATAPQTPVAGGATPYFAPPNGGQPPLVVRQMNTPGAWIFISYPVPGLHDADQPAVRVLAAALGESSSSRLSQRLLSSRPLSRRAGATAAQVAVQYAPRRFSSEFIAFAQSDAQHVEDVKNAMLDEVRKLRETPLSKMELARAKNYVQGNWAVEREGLHERAFRAAFAPAVGATSDTDWPARVGAVTAEDVRRVAAKYMQAYAVALIMPEE